MKDGGNGQKVEVNLLNSALHMQSQELCYYINTGIMPKKSRGLYGTSAAGSPVRHL